MTAKELSQLKYIRQEVQQLQDEIASIEAAAEPGAQKITGMPSSGGCGDKIGDCASAAEDLKMLLQRRKADCERERLRLETYIAGVQDSQMRMILRLRYVNDLTWVAIAIEIGGNNTADGVRMMHNRFLRSVA